TDFASAFGVGAIIGSNFAWPGAPGQKDAKLLLTPERQVLWAKWVKLFNQQRLVDGEYLGTLYDIGFDKPETHAIAKGKAMYYASYAPKFAGSVQLRGLQPGRYRIRDYVNDRELGEVSAPGATLDVKFERSLLIEALRVPLQPQ